MSRISFLLRRAFSSSAASASSTTVLYREADLNKLAETFRKHAQLPNFRKKSSIYSHTIQRLASARKFTLIEEILEEHKKYKDITDEGFTVRLITLYGKSNMFDHAHKLFDEMTQLKCERTVLSFNALLGACVSSKNFDKVDGFFRELPGKLGIKPDVVSYNTVIKSLCETGSLDAAVSLHDEMVKEGLKPDVVTFNILFDAFYKSRFLDGEKLWVRMGEFNVAPDVMSCNSRLYGLVSENKIQEAVDFVEEILSKGLELDVYTYSILFKGFCRDEKYIGEAKRWFDKMMRTKCPPNRSIFSVLLRYACNCNDFHFASRLCRALFYRHCRLSEGQGELLQKVVDGLVKQLNIKEAELLVKLGKGSKYSCYHSLKMPKFDN